MHSVTGFHGVDIQQDGFQVTNVASASSQNLYTSNSWLRDLVQDHSSTLCYDPATEYAVWDTLDA